MSVAPTSIATYRDIESSLPARRALVLDRLRVFIQERGECPTSYELFVSMRAAHLAADHNSVRPRLTELYQQKLVERPDKRSCRITGRVAYVWRPRSRQGQLW